MKNPDRVGVIGGYFFKKTERIFLTGKLIGFEGVELDVISTEKVAKESDLGEELRAFVKVRSEKERLADFFRWE